MIEIGAVGTNDDAPQANKVKTQIFKIIRVGSVTRVDRVTPIKQKEMLKDDTLLSSVTVNPLIRIIICSLNPIIHKLVVIRTLNYRADTVISEEEQVPEEKGHIRSALADCGYTQVGLFKRPIRPDKTTLKDVFCSKYDKVYNYK